MMLTPSCPAPSCVLLSVTVSFAAYCARLAYLHIALRRIKVDGEAESAFVALRIELNLHRAGSSRAEW